MIPWHLDQVWRQEHWLTLGIVACGYLLFAGMTYWAHQNRWPFDNEPKEKEDR